MTDVAVECDPLELEIELDHAAQRVIDAHAAIAQTNSDRSAQVIQIDNGKHVNAVAICASLCGICMVFSLWASVTAWSTGTEYRIQINHTMELEAQQKVLIKEVEELKHEHR